MELKEIRTIETLMKWIEENIKNRMCGGDLREEAEWFLACSYAAGWSENRTKDNAYFVLEGMTPLKGNDEEAKNHIDIFWEDADHDAEYLDDAIETLKNQLEWHWAITIVDGQVCRVDED